MWWLLSLCLHTYIGNNFNIYVLLKNYHVCEVGFLDVCPFKYNGRVFKQLENRLKQIMYGHVICI